MKNILTCSLLLLATNLTSTNVFAHDTCNIKLESGIKITNQHIQFLDDEKNSLYKIIDDQILVIDGQPIALNDNQQSIITQYSTNIRAVVPQVKDIALDAIELASEGINLAFNELLGEGNDVGAEVTGELAIIQEQLASHFASNKGIYIDNNGIDRNGVDGDEILGEDFQERINGVVEKIIKNSMGSLLIAVGQQILYSAGDMDAFETRMEDFSEHIADEMQRRSQAFEARGQLICTAVVDIDTLETNLQSSISALSTINVISTNHI